MCNVSIIIVNLTMKHYRPHPRKFESLKIWQIALELPIRCSDMLWMYVASLEHHIDLTVFMPTNGCVCLGNKAFPTFINVLTETSRFDRSFLLLRKIPCHQVGIYREWSSKNDWIPTALINFHPLEIEIDFPSFLLSLSNSSYWW